MPSTPAKRIAQPDVVRTPGHGGEYSGKNAPGVSFPVLPRPLKKARRRWRALVETGNADGVRDADPTKAFWFGGDRDEGTALATQLIARQQAEQAIIEAWY